MISFIQSCDIKNKNVFLRIDGNVPLKNGVIQDDFRLRAVVPTIEYLITAGATSITIGTHLGRPISSADKSLSVAPLARWFAEKKLHGVYMLENLRFDPREKNLDLGYARELAAGHDVYVNDAWGALHRTETSISILPTLFAPDNRAYGLLVERELTALAPLRVRPKKPYVLFIGGGKLPDKLDALSRLVEKKLVTTIVLLPGIVFTFLAAQGVAIGRSLVFPELFDRCKKLLDLAAQNNIQVHIPEDFLAQDATGLITTGREIPATAQGITIGPKTLSAIETGIADAQTIFYTGAMGYGNGWEDDIRYQEKLQELFTDITKTSAYTVIGGGDSVAAGEAFELTQKFSWCSTGGGSTLAFISGAQLPGLAIDPSA